MTTLAHVLLLVLVGMDPAPVSGNITECAPGCGTQINNQFIDYCFGEDSVVNEMIGTK